MLKWYITDMFLYSTGIICAIFLFFNKRPEINKKNGLILILIYITANISLGLFSYSINKDIGFTLIWLYPPFLLFFILKKNRNISGKESYIIVNNGTILYLAGTAIVNNGTILVSKYDFLKPFFGYHQISFYITHIIIVSLFYTLFYQFTKSRKDEKKFSVSNEMIVYWILIFILLNALLIIRQTIPSEYLYIKIIINSGLVIIGILVLGLYHLFYRQSSNLIEELEMKNSLKTMEQLIRLEKNESELYEKIINDLNIKCHDLKYDLYTKDVNCVKPELEEMIKIYDSKIKTGNKALDIILTDKNILCTHNNISFSYIVDGKELDFIDDSDIYYLFGNALDNAIEYLTGLENRENKFIIVNVSRKNQFIIITIENNFYENDSYSEENLPQTTKNDTMKHGFGLKSINNVTKKYSGSLKLTTLNNIFKLKIVFPITFADYHT